MAKMVYGHIFAGAGFSGASFDIAAGPANTDIIDALLSAGDGTLTEDTPHALVSTGALGAARTLDISALEVESANKGGQALEGRFFYLSIQNTDISSTNSITVSGSGTINGAASLVISTRGDYLFHHISGGVWRVNVLPTPAESIATIARIPFTAATWDAGAQTNRIQILATGAPAAGQVGPHNLTAYSSYVVQVINTDLTPDELVDVEVQFAANGDITLRKSGGVDFNGVAVIIGSLD